MKVLTGFQIISSVDGVVTFRVTIQEIESKPSGVVAVGEAVTLDKTIDMTSESAQEIVFQ